METIIKKHSQSKCRVPELSPNIYTYNTAPEPQASKKHVRKQWGEDDKSQRYKYLVVKLWLAEMSNLQL